MTTTGDANQRVGNVERQAAVEALNQHWQEGRLDPAEHERRTTAAHAAVTRGDLDTLFTDLPGGAPGTSPVSGAAPAPVAAPGQSPAPTSPSSSGGSALFPADSWVGRYRNAMMGLAPLVALVLFFVTGYWWWFLLIPAAGVVLYAGDDDSRRRDRRGY